MTPQREAAATAASEAQAQLKAAQAEVGSLRATLKESHEVCVGVWGVT